METKELGWEDDDDDARKEAIGISIHAFTRSKNHRKLRITGLIKKRKMSIVIVRGSIHSFIDES